MDCESKSIVSTITVDKRETSLKSVKVEKLALQRSLEVLSSKLDISELVTDAHVQIAAYVRGIVGRNTDRIIKNMSHLTTNKLTSLYRFGKLSVLKAKPINSDQM